MSFVRMKTETDSKVRGWIEGQIVALSYISCSGLRRCAESFIGNDAGCQRAGPFPRHIPIPIMPVFFHQGEVNKHPQRARTTPRVRGWVNSGDSEYSGHRWSLG